MKPTRLRILATMHMALMAGVLAAGPTAQLVHLSHGHTICPVHGEVLEVRGGGHAARMPAPSGIALSGGDAGAASDWSHDVCPFADPAAPDRPPVALALEVRSCPTAWSAPLADDPAPRSRLLLLLLAPKSSPPLS